MLSSQLLQSVVRTGRIKTTRGSVNVIGSIRYGSNISVILLQDLNNRGKKGDIVEVKRGTFVTEQNA